MQQMRILCYGDSNTWGYISGSNHLRYGNDKRWPKVLANLLGDNFEVIEEGLNSRTLISNDLRPGKEGKNGYEYLLSRNYLMIQGHELESKIMNKWPALNSIKRGQQQENVMKNFILDRIISEYPEYISMDFISTFDKIV